MNTLLDLMEKQPLQSVTTANIAKHLGISEAALYRHFPSKDKMFSTLLNLLESLLYLRMNAAMKPYASALVRCYHLARTWLTMAEQKPGTACILSGQFLLGTNSLLSNDHTKFCERFELQIKHLLKEAAVKDGIRLALPQSTSASFIMHELEGRTWRFIRSRYTLKPTLLWQEHWKIVADSLQH